VDRRTFLQSSASASAAVAATGALPAAHARELAQQRPRPFTLRYAPHFGMFPELTGSRDLVAQLEFMAAEGFTALEDNGMRGRSVADQERIAAAMTRLGMHMGVFVAHTIDWNAPTLTARDASKREQFLAEIRDSVEVAKRVNAKWITVVPGHVESRPDLTFQTATVIEVLKRAAAILEPHGIVMVLEPLNTRVNHPGMFLTHIGQAHAICVAVGSPSCKILYDVYHQQITEGHLIPNFDAAWDQIAYVQTGDNPGRREPGTGEINYANVFAHLVRKGYDGIVGMEHGVARAGREGERAAIDAYRRVDPAG
jgi:hydroxypyruvate isomerase